MDADTNDIASGLTNCVTRDGESLPSANLPMNSFRHTGASDGQATTDYASVGQAQSGSINWIVAGGTSDALTAAYAIPIAVLTDGQLCYVRAIASNVTSTPTFAPNVISPLVITKLGGSPLAPGDIAGSLAEIILRYNLANTRWELLNPNISGTPQTGAVLLTLAGSPQSGWLMFDDGTFGSASSGSSNSNSTANQALFNMIFSNISDTWAPLLTSTGVATTRAAQGSAAAAWAANCRMSLPKTLGRVLGVAGSGSGLTTRGTGQPFGEENHTLAQAELPNVSVAVSGSISGTAAGNISSSVADIVRAGGAFGPSAAQAGGAANYIGLGSGGVVVGNITSGGSMGVTGSFSGGTSGLGGSLSHNNMQPTTFLNAMVKL